jgi:hypothetical protein
VLSSHDRGWRGRGFLIIESVTVVVSIHNSEDVGAELNGHHDHDDNVNYFVTPGVLLEDDHGLRPLTDGDATVTGVEVEVFVIVVHTY